MQLLSTVSTNRPVFSVASVVLQHGNGLQLDCLDFNILVPINVRVRGCKGQLEPGSLLELRLATTHRNANRTGSLAKVGIHTHPSFALSSSETPAGFQHPQYLRVAASTRDGPCQPAEGHLAWESFPNTAGESHPKNPARDFWCNGSMAPNVIPAQGSSIRSSAVLPCASLASLSAPFFSSQITASINLPPGTFQTEPHGQQATTALGLSDNTAQ